MDNQDRWLLPDGIEELLPPVSTRLERIRRTLLDLFESWGYAYVVPPPAEFIESLLTGTGRDLDLKTFKLTDQVSGRQMGLRADMTSQAARMDTHSINRVGQVRLSYAGTVMHARADHMLASRTPELVGAELFGEPGIAGDIEITSLMCEALLALTVNSPLVELGDVGIVRELLAIAGLPTAIEARVFELIQAKALPELEQALAETELPARDRAALTGVAELAGDSSVIPAASALFADYPALLERVDRLQAIASAVTARFPTINLCFDLSELRGYHYHTGVVVAAYGEGVNAPIAKGGRYDGVGTEFGQGSVARSRAATGFDIDIKTMAKLDSTTGPGDRTVVIAPVRASDDAAESTRWQAVQTLRKAGHIVIEGDAGLHDRQRQLAFLGGRWQVVD